jgi:hypothetical protein
MYVCFVHLFKILCDTDMCVCSLKYLMLTGNYFFTIQNDVKLGQRLLWRRARSPIAVTTAAADEKAVCVGGGTVYKTVLALLQQY